MIAGRQMCEGVLAAEIKEIERRILVAYSPKRWGNAEVSAVRYADGSHLVIKDFSKSPWVIRQTSGRFLLWREARALRRLLEVDGVPGPPVIRAAWQLKCPFIDSFNLREAPVGEPLLDAAFFEKLEALVIEMHRRNVVHLDLRNARNVLASKDGNPVLIDFQTALFTNLMPGFLKRMLFSIDLSAVYKHWHKYHPESLTRERKEVFNRMASVRGFWFIKGYPLREFRRKRREKGPKSKRNRQKIDLD